MQPKSRPFRDGLYERISDDREGLELGVTRQDEDLRALSAATGGVVADVYRDNDISASTRSRKTRPEYDRLIAGAAAGRIDRILAYTSSRLTRRPRELEDLIELAERHGVTFSYLRSPSLDLNTADGRQVARMLAASDAAEAERTGERVTRKRAQKRAAGEYLGGPRRYGKERDGVTVREYEAERLRAASRRVLGGVGLQTICREWSAAGVPTARWHPPLRLVAWQSQALRHILLRPDLGDLVGAETASALGAVLRNPKRGGSGGRPPRWLGSRLYLCGVCEQPRLVVTKGEYRCRAEDGSWQHIARKAGPVDEFVESVVALWLSEDEHRGLLQAPRPAVNADALRAESVELEQTLTELAEDRAARRITREQMLVGTAAAQARIAEIAGQLATTVGGDALDLLPPPEKTVAWWFGDGPERTGGAPLAERRAILRRAVRVTVYPVGRPGARTFDPDSVRVEFGLQD